MTRTVCSIALLTLLLGTGQAQETETKYDLRIRFTKGQEWTRVEKGNWSMKGTAAVSGQEFPNNHAGKEDAEYTETVLEVDKDGRRNKIKRTYKTKTESATTNGKTKDTTSPLAGKEVVVVREGKKVRLISPKTLHIDVLEDLQLDEGFETISPKEPVPVGHKWSAKGEAVRKIFDFDKKEFQKGTMKARFVEVTTHNGRKAAKIELELTLEAKVGDEKLPLAFAVKGTFYIDLERHLPLELSYKGTIKMEGEGVVGGDQKMTVKSSGPMEFKATSTVRK